jgi:hypothetical protein
MLLPGPPRAPSKRKISPNAENLNTGDVRLDDRGAVMRSIETEMVPDGFDRPRFDLQGGYPSL